MWSDKHFEYMKRSLQLMSELGSRYAIADICIGYRTRGNTDGMVRWVKQNGGYEYDFKVFDRYLDVVAEVLGKPHPLRLNLWGEVRKDKKTGKPDWVYSCGKYVPLLDPATGKVERLEQPLPGTPQSEKLWRPVLAEIRKRLDRRGWFDVTGVGDVRYAGLPDPKKVSMLHRIWPDGKWIATQHGLQRSFKTTDGKRIPALASTTVWNEGKLRGRVYGGQRVGAKWMHFSYGRNRHVDDSPLWIHRALPEEMIMRGHFGVGPLGGDSWPLARTGRKGRNAYEVLGGNSALGPNCSTRALLAPGPDGPVATERYEAFREGVQICEALIFLQRAVKENKIGGKLAERVNRLLDERAGRFLKARNRREKSRYSHMRLFYAEVERDSAEWARLDRALFAMTGEVSGAMGLK